MKKIITLLFFAGFIGSAFAQSNRGRQGRDQSTGNQYQSPRGNGSSSPGYSRNSGGNNASSNKNQNTGGTMNDGYNQNNSRPNNGGYNQHNGNDNWSDYTQGESRNSNAEYGYNHRSENRERREMRGSGYRRGHDYNERRYDLILTAIEENHIITAGFTGMINIDKYIKPRNFWGLIF